MEINIEDQQSLEKYLITAGYLEANEKWSATILSGGVSNKAILFNRPEKEIRWVIKQALPKLRVEADWFCDPGRLVVEYQGMQWLSKILPAEAVPEPVFMDQDNFIMAMTAVPQPHDNLKQLLLQGRLQSSLIEEMGQLLGRIHSAGYQSDPAVERFQDRSYFKTLRLEPYYQFTTQNLPEAASFFHQLIDQTLAIRQTVVHGDFSPKNMLVKDGHLVLLDHEVMHYGDPAFDLGFCLCHLLSKANHLVEHRKAFLELAGLFWESYEKTAFTSDEDLEKRAVQHTLGCLFARILGRSPLEYLDEGGRTRQLKASLNLLSALPPTLPELIGNFGSSLP